MPSLPCHPLTARSLRNSQPNPAYLLTSSLFQIPVRLAGIDAPECAHFGKPAQPFSSEALAWLESYILGRRVRAHIYRRDQYERVVATVYVRKPLFFGLLRRRRDVGLEMLREGLATTYEGKIGAEFGGEKMERRYRDAEEEARRRGRGMWSVEKGAGKGGDLGEGVEREEGGGEGGGEPDGVQEKDEGA